MPTSHTLWLAPVTITLANLAQYKNTPPTAVADATFDAAWVYSNLVK